MKKSFSCLKRLTLLGLLVPSLAMSSAQWMPEYGEADTGLSVTLITSLHGNGAGITEDEDGTPQGWPQARQIRSDVVPVSGANGDFLYVVQRGGFLRVPPVPTSHYQVAPPPDYSHLGGRANGQGIGLVQRANGDLIGAVNWSISCIRTNVIEDRIPGINCKAHPVTGERMPDWHVEDSTNILLTTPDIESFGYGMLYRTEYDAVNGNPIMSTKGQLYHPYGVLVADGDVVYGMDRGEEGRTRLYRLDADDSLDFLFTFSQLAGRNQVGNGFVLAEVRGSEINTRGDAR